MDECVLWWNLFKTLKVFYRPACRLKHCSKTDHSIDSNVLGAQYLMCTVFLFAENTVRIN